MLCVNPLGYRKQAQYHSITESPYLYIYLPWMVQIRYLVNVSSGSVHLTLWLTIAKTKIKFG